MAVYTSGYSTINKINVEAYGLIKYKHITVQSHTKLPVYSKIPT